MSRKPFVLYLVRHGKTKATEKNLYCGNTDLALSRAGRRELQKNRERYPVCDGYFSSGMIRCNETLEILLGQALSPEELVILPFLREINLGFFDMKSHEDLKERPEYIRWINDNTGSVKPPGGESKNMFLRRVSMGFLGLTQRILQHKLDTAMCITHGGVIVAVMQSIFPKFDSGKHLNAKLPEPGSGYKLLHSGDSGYVEFEGFNL